MNPSQYLLPWDNDDEKPRRTRRQRTRWRTSDEAYSSAPLSAEERIVEYIKARPSSCDNVMLMLNIKHQTASPAINKLMRAGVLVVDGSTLTSGNRRAKIWKWCDCPVPIETPNTPSRSSLIARIAELEARIAELEAR